LRRIINWLLKTQKFKFTKLLFGAIDLKDKIGD